MTATLEGTSDRVRRAGILGTVLKPLAVALLAVVLAATGVALVAGAGADLRGPAFPAGVTRRAVLAAVLLVAYGAAAIAAPLHAGEMSPQVFTEGSSAGPCAAP